MTDINELENDSNNERETLEKLVKLEKFYKKLKQLNDWIDLDIIDSKKELENRNRLS